MKYLLVKVLLASSVMCLEGLSASTIGSGPDVDGPGMGQGMARTALSPFIPTSTSTSTLTSSSFPPIAPAPTSGGARSVVRAAPIPLGSPCAGTGCWELGALPPIPFSTSGLFPTPADPVPSACLSGSVGGAPGTGSFSPATVPPGAFLPRLVSDYDPPVVLAPRYGGAQGGAYGEAYGGGVSYGEGYGGGVIQTAMPDPSAAPTAAPPVGPNAIKLRG